jgi:hypothetical protein
MISRQVLEYGQSEYVRQFPDKELLDLEARIIKAPALRYNLHQDSPNLN